MHRIDIMYSKLLKPALVCGLFLFILLLPEVQGQVTNIPTPDEVTKLLNENNITEAEFQAAMLVKGYDPNNLDIKTVDLAELERLIEEAKIGGPKKTSGCSGGCTCSKRSHAKKTGKILPAKF